MVGMTSDHVCCEWESDTSLSVTSGGNLAHAAGVSVYLDDAGTKTTGVIRRDQPRTIDMEPRNGKRLEQIPAVIMNEVLARLSCGFDMRNEQ